MKISIVVVSWNVADKLKKCLEALVASSGDFELDIFVIDNNSSDNSVEIAEKFGKKIKLIKNEKNVGLSRAINQVKEKLDGDYVLLLNPDNVVFEDSLAKMINWMEKNKQAWVASCRLVNEAGETIKHVRRFPKLPDQLAIVLKLPHIRPGILKKYIIEDFDYNKPAKVDSVRGAFFMIRKECKEKLGLWDADYFIWFEEVDYCKQVREAGGEVWYTPVAECIDYVGQSFAQVSIGTKQKYFRNSMLKYFKKWHPRWQYWILRFAWLFSPFIIKILSFLKKGKTRSIS